mmetsp:Transcript_107190/g.189838  ORF Transcript_107190/g.189838 Transcript_107190/m.189838 type:complete len:81 (-) Transcript_107190:855-1097(-)
MEPMEGGADDLSPGDCDPLPGDCDEAADGAGSSLETITEVGTPPKRASPACCSTSTDDDDVIDGEFTDMPSAAARSMTVC